MANSENLDIVIKAKDEASAVMAKVQKNTGQLGETVKKMGLAVAAAGVAAGAAVSAFAISSVKQFSEVGDAVDKMAQRTGLGAEAVSALRVAADASGTSIESVEMAVKKMQIGIDQLNPSNKEFQYYLKAIGTTMEDIRKTSPAEQFETIGNAIANITDPAERTRLAMEAFGKAGTDLIPLFEEGQFSMAAWSEQAKKLGVSFDDISAAKAAALNDAIGKMGAAWNGLKLKIGGELAPVVTDFIEKRLVPLAEKIIASAPTIEQMTAAVTAAKTAIMDAGKAFLDAMKVLDEKTGILTQVRDAFFRIWEVLKNNLWPALKELWEALQPLMPFLAALAGIVGLVLVGALKILIEQITVWIEVGTKVLSVLTSVVAFLIEQFQPAIDDTKAFILSLIEPIERVIRAFDRVREAASKAFAKASSVLSGAVPSQIPGRAEGGPVMAGRPYIVGEEGPELFVPRSSGAIVPNGGAMQISVMAGATVHVSGSADEDRLAQRISRMLADVLRDQRLGNATLS